MRKLLLLFFALLTGVSGAWAFDVTAIPNNGSGTYPNGELSDGGTTWYKTFTTNTTSGLYGITLFSSNAIIAHSTTRPTGQDTRRGLAIKSTNTGSAETITIQAPEHFIITGFSTDVSSHADSKNFTITYGEESLTSNHTAYQTFNPTITEGNSVIITVSHASGNTDTNSYLMLTNFTLTLKTEAGAKITGANQLGASRKYYIQNYDVDVRGYFCLNSGNTYVTSTKTNTSATDAQKEFALVPYNGKHFLYSVSQNKFVSSANQTFAAQVLTTLSNTPTNALTLTTSTYSSSQTCKLTWDANTSFNLNISSSEVKLLSSENNDQGTHFYIVDAGEYTDACATAISKLDAFVSTPDITSGKYYSFQYYGGSDKYLSTSMHSSNTETKAYLKITDIGETNAAGKKIFSLFESTRQQYLAYTSVEKNGGNNTDRFQWTSNATNSRFVISQDGEYYIIRPDKATDKNYVGFWNSANNANLILWDWRGDYDKWTIAVAEDCDVTYKLPGTSLEDVVISQVQGTALTAPSSWTRDGVTFSYYSTYSDGVFSNPITNVAEESSQIVYVDYTYSLSSLLSASTSSLKWYRLAGLSSSTYYDLYYNESAPYPYKVQSAFDGSDGYFWAFVGNPFDGVKVYNKAVATTNTLIHNDNTNPVMGTDDGTTWYITVDGSGRLGFQYSGNTSHRWNDYGGGASTLKYWSNETWHQYTSINDVDFSVLYTANIKPYVDNAGDGYFKISSTDAATLNSEYTTANSDEAITLSEYSSLVSSLNSKINWPSTGYYRVKSVSADTYLKAEDATQLTVGGTGNEAGSIVYLNGSAGTYTMQMQGGYAKVQSNAYPAVVNSSSATVYFTIPTVEGAISPGQVTMGHGETATDNFGVSGSNVVGQNTSSGTSTYWTVENASTFDVTLNSINSSDYFATMCVPYEVTMPANITAYTISSVDATTATAASAATAGSNLTAGTPVVLEGKASSVTMNINTGVAPVATPVTGNLTGTFTDLTGLTASTDYFLGTDDSKVGFFKWDQTTLTANHAYIEASKVSSVKGFYLDLGDADGINEIMRNGGNEEMSAVYDLSGRRVVKPTKGLYIVNGKKVVK